MKKKSYLVETYLGKVFEVYAYSDEEAKNFARNILTDTQDGDDVEFVSCMQD